ncbi:uncharacterized protein LOC116308509, partial [Actinia tenebrosa]|uniref:Uncharacterized protein LOC116308509 n=1 Tax=Actinia tenebrosa TaxID=6105 RepID=A0A6P8J460_ACTTE
MFLYILIVVAQLTGRGSRYVNALCTNDFEEGISSLKGWERSGDAFNNQPTYGDNPSIRKPGIHASHQGRYWIGTYEDRPKPDSRPGKVQSDFPTGKLTSPAFRITGTDINFLIGGGCDQSKVRAELLINGSVVEYDTGKCSETMRRVHWSVGRYRGQTAKIRLVDNSSQGWGHLNFDDLKGDMKCEDTASGSPITASTGSKITETIRSESPKMMEESNPTPMSPTGSPTTASAGSTTPSGKTSGNPKMMEGSNPTSMSPTGSPTKPSAGSTTPSGKTSGNPKMMEGSKPTSTSPTGSQATASAGSTTPSGKTSGNPKMME